MIHKQNTKKPFLFLLIFTIILAQAYIVFLHTPEKNNRSNSMITNRTNGIVGDSNPEFPVNSKITSYTDTQPIVIKSNADLQSKALTLGFPGNGSQSNPYIIENFRIVNTSANVNGIDIENTYNYFIIKNNYISCNGTGSNGIYFQSVTSNTAVIENNTITGNGKAGIYIFYSFFVTISNNILTNNNNYALYLNQATSSVISSNTITGQTNSSGTISNCYGGIYETSDNLIIVKNNISENTYGICILSIYTNNTIEENYFANNSGFSIYVSTSGSNQKTIIKSNFLTKNSNQAVWISNSQNSIISNNTFDYNSVTPLWISSYGLYNTIINNSFTNNGEYGLWLSSIANGNLVDRNYFYNNTQGGISVSSGADNNSIAFNTIVNNGYGIYGYPTHTNITDNYIENCSSYGFYFTNMVNVTIENNFLYKGVSDGIYLYGSTNVTVTNNTVISFGGYGIRVYDTNPNKIYLNNFLHNRNGLTQAYSSTNNDIWDNGTYGNFWFDYSGSDSNSNGIGDTPYTFIGSGQDNYPLMIWYGIKLAPQFLITPSSNTFEEGNVIDLTWKPIDDNPNQYQIFIDNVVNSSGSFTSRSNISISISGLLVGNHNVTIALTDLDTFISANTVFLNVIDTTPPFVIGLTNYTYNETTTGHTLNWNVTDLNPGSYEIFLDGVSSQNGTWTSGSTIFYSVDGLLMGMYNVTIKVNDSYNNIAINTTMLSVYDGTHPIVSHPTNISFEYGYPTGNLTWTAMDSYPYNYTIYLNGTLYETANWTSGSVISITLDYLIPGTWNYTIIVMDTSHLTARNTVFITVTPDATAPVVNSPTNINIPYGTIGQSIVWNASDLHPGNYVLYKNNVVASTGSWDNSTGVFVSLDSLLPGNYNFTVVFFDTNNNQVKNTVLVNVSLATSVAINSPNDISYQEGLSNYSLNWTILSNSSWSYILLRNASVVQTGNGLNNGSIIYSLSALSVGTYNYTVAVTTASNTVTDTIFVNVLAKPSVYYVAINSPNDINYQEGLSNYSLNWAITSNGTWTYSIVRNGSSVQSGGGANNVSVVYNLISLSAGTYNFTIMVNTSTVFVQNTIFVQVIDQQPPIVNQLSNLTFTEGSGSHILTWNAKDLHPGIYRIEINGTQIKSGSWSNSTAITYDISTLASGYYIITISVFDSYNNSISSTTYVTVLSSTPNTSGASSLTSSANSSSITGTSTQPKTSSNSTVTTSNLNGLEIILLVAFTTIYLKRKLKQN